MIHRLLRAASLPMRLGFESSLAKPEQTQRALLKKITRRFLPQALSYERFASLYPIADWEAQKKTGLKVLTSDVLFYEKTTGSRAAPKEIPYTPELRSAFSKMFLLWAGDTLAHETQLAKGKIFASVSPGFSESQEDLDYVSPLITRLLKNDVVDTSALKHCKDTSDFYNKLTEVFLHNPDIEIVSIWSPTYLLSWLEQGGDPSILPNLKLISCWASGSSKVPAQKLAAFFPHVKMQFKGLLCTETPVTIPWRKQGFIPLIEDVFIEGRDSSGEMIPLWKFQKDQELELIVTQQSGLWRYRVGDRIKVTENYRGTPCFDLLGRMPHIIDLTGEKFHEDFLLEAIGKISPRHSHLVIADDLNRRYVIAGSDKIDIGEVENLFRKNPHYDLSRRQGQLESAEFIYESSINSVLLESAKRAGIRIGDIKPSPILGPGKHAQSLLSLLRS